MLDASEIPPTFGMPPTLIIGLIAGGDTALRKLRPQIEAAGVSIGYSNSRTCEIGLTTNSGIPYVSIV